MRLERICLSALFAALPVLATGCGAKEEPKAPVIEEPETVSTAKSETQEAPEVPEPAVTPAETAPLDETPEAPQEESAEMEATDAPKVTVAEPETEEKAEEPAEEVDVTPEEEVVPIDLNANAETLAFFPKIEVGQTLEKVIDTFLEDNYMNLALLYIGPSEEKVAKYKGNIHFTYCKSDTAEGIVITSATGTSDNNGILIYGSEGMVGAYLLSNKHGEVDVPDDFPPLEVNWPATRDAGQIPEDIMQFLRAIQPCGFGL